MVHDDSGADTTSHSYPIRRSNKLWRERRRNGKRDAAHERNRGPYTAWQQVSVTANEGENETRRKRDTRGGATHEEEGSDTRRGGEGEERERESVRGKDPQT